MSEIELHWNILREEGRVLKAAADLTKLSCKMIPKDYNSPQIPLASKSIIDSVETLKQLQSQLPKLCSLFGENEQQRKSIQKAVQLYNKNFKPYLRLSIWQLISQSDSRAKIEKLNLKKAQIEQAVNELEQFMGTIKTKFICGQRITIVDLLLYFDVCNLTYFSKNPSHYENIWKWFQHVYAFREIKVITHQWFAMAKQISPLFKLKKSRSKL